MLKQGKKRVVLLQNNLYDVIIILHILNTYLSIFYYLMSSVVFTGKQSLQHEN
jgi:hypothetical protein